MLVELKTLWPAYVPIPAGMRGDGKLSTILNAPGTFDDKMIVVDASDRGEKRGNAMPLLLDLARPNLFLHDASVPSLDALLDPRRGKNAPHPFYIDGVEDRKAMIEFLRGLETGSTQARSKQISERVRARNQRTWLIAFPKKNLGGLDALRTNPHSRNR